MGRQPGGLGGEGLPEVTGGRLNAAAGGGRHGDGGGRRPVAAAAVGPRPDGESGAAQVCRSGAERGRRWVEGEGCRSRAMEGEQARTPLPSVQADPPAPSSLAPVLGPPSPTRLSHYSPWGRDVNIARKTHSKSPQKHPLTCYNLREIRKANVIRLNLSLIILST